jgi:molybdopterin synthase catalytic subunit
VTTTPELAAAASRTQPARDVAVDADRTGPPVLLLTSPIDVASLEESVAGPAHGAVVTFAGTVRDHDHGRPVVALRYEGHPTAAGTLRQLVAEVAARHPDARVAVAHRVGDLEVGDVAFAVAVGAAHRGPAFAACSDAVETVKAGLPVWKHQDFADGTSEWVNCA